MHFGIKAYGRVFLPIPTQTENVLVTNGDTLFKVAVEELAKKHFAHDARCTLALKPMEEFDRFGVVEIDENECVQSFQEKKYYAEGLINGGLYVLDVAHFLKNEFPEKFSFEKDYLEKQVNLKRFYASVQDTYFIDMGVPQDYRRASKEL